MSDHLPANLLNESFCNKRLYQNNTVPKIPGDIKLRCLYFNTINFQLKLCLFSVEFTFKIYYSVPRGREFESTF